MTGDLTCAGCGHFHGATCPHCVCTTPDYDTGQCEVCADFGCADCAS